MRTIAAGRRTALVVALVGLGALLAGCADEEESDSEAGGDGTLAGFIADEHARHDDDGDGLVSADEADAAIREDFAASDVDRDGMITIADIQAELDQAGAGKADKPLSHYLPYARPGDDSVSEEEYVREVRRQTLEPMDANGDGAIAADEATEFHAAVGPRR